MQCRMVKHWLDQHDLNYTVKNIDDDLGVRDELKSKGYQTVPITMTDELTIHGFAPNKLEELI